MFKMTKRLDLIAESRLLTAKLRSKTSSFRYFINICSSMSLRRIFNEFWKVALALGFGTSVDFPGNLISGPENRSPLANAPKLYREGLLISS